MRLSQDLKDFALYICPILTMIGVIITLIVTVQINKDILMGVSEMRPVRNESFRGPGNYK